MKLFLTLLLCFTISIALSDNTFGQQKVTQIKSSTDTSTTKLKKASKKKPKQKSQIKKANSEEMKPTREQQEEMEIRRGLLLKETRKDTAAVK